MTLDVFFSRVSTDGRMTETVNPFTKERTRVPAPDPLDESRFNDLTSVLTPMGFEPTNHALKLDSDGLSMRLDREGGTMNIAAGENKDAIRIAAEASEVALRYGYLINGACGINSQSDTPIHQQFESAMKEHNAFAAESEGRLAGGPSEALRRALKELEDTE